MATPKATSPVSPTSTPAQAIPDSLWEQFVPRLRAGIAAEYDRLPDKSTALGADNIDWMRAFLTYLKVLEPTTQKQSSWWHDNITGLMVISALMALAFGCFGVWGLLGTADTKLASATSGFLDIAKLFAGTLADLLQLRGVGACNPLILLVAGGGGCGNVVV